MTNTNIASTAMLVDLRISQWTARKTDKRAALEVAVNHNAASRSGTYYKSLIDGSALDPIKEIAGAARTYHYKMTLPWADTGPRALKSTAYFEYMQQMQAFGAMFDTAVQTLLTDYPLHRQEAKRLLGSLFNDDDYPYVHQLREKFGFRTAVTPLPTGDDFRVNLNDDVIEAKLRAEISANTNAVAGAALKDAFDRIAKVTAAFVDRLGNPDAVFRDSLVENARDLCDVLPHLNLTDDTTLSSMADRLRDKLTQFDAEQLRRDPKARRETHAEAVAMHADVMSFFGGAQ